MANAFDTDIKGQSLKDMSTQRSDVFWVDPRELNIKPGWNVRVWKADDEEDLNLAKSIAKIGVQDPLHVFREAGKVFISEGHRRIGATMYAIANLGADHIRKVPVIAEQRGTSEADLVVRQLLDGKPKTPYEQAQLFKRLVGYGWTVEEIAEQACKSVAAVNMGLDLMGAPEGVKKLVASGKVSATLAVQTVSKEGGQGALETLTEAVSNAAEQGKEKATARDLPSTPTSQRVSAKMKMARVGELVAEAAGETEAANTLTFSPKNFEELLELVGLLG